MKVELLFEEGHVLKKEGSLPERAGRGVLYFVTREAEVEGRSNKGDRKMVASRKGVKEGSRWHAANFRSSLVLHEVEKFRMKGECEGEQGECEGEREGEWF